MVGPERPASFRYFFSLQTNVTFAEPVKFIAVSNVACQALRSLTQKGLNDAQLMSNLKGKGVAATVVGGSVKSC